MCVWVGEGETVVGYVRVSTEEQGASGAGLEAQRRAIENECARRGWELVRIEQDVLSARSMNRPGLRVALDACRSGEVAGIVVAKLDRLSRSVIDFGKLLAEANRGDWNIVALDFGLDLTTPQGKLVANLLMSVAEWEREVIGQRTREGLAAKRSQGVRLGRPRSLPARVRTRIRRMRTRGMTLEAIARKLNDEGVPTAQGGQRWYASTVRALAADRTAA
jgi:DNA invertase Pin-like site-specific DNA recombinase